MSASKFHGAEDVPRPQGEAIQIVTFEMRENRASRMRLDKLLMKNVLRSVGDREVALISIAGPTRKGKSFIMSYLVSFLQKTVKNGAPTLITEYSSTKPLKGFHFKNGFERETVGIYIWSEPFILVRSDGSEVAVLLMDTQGVFDDQTGEREWSAIIGLSMLTSSCLIYNIFNDLNEDVFVMLNSFMQQGLRTIDYDDRKCFQRLIFLIRDWNNPTQYRYGPFGGKQFITEKLKPRKGMTKESRESRLILNSCFEDVDCFLFPPPGERAKDVNFTGSNAELEPSFIDNVTCFVKDLLLSPDDIQSKRIGDSHVTGNGLYSYFEKYVDAFNQSNITTTFQDALVHGSCAAAEEQALGEYKAEIKKRVETTELLSLQELQRAHQECTALSLQYFNNQKILGDGNLIVRYRTLLEANVKKVFEEIVAKNDDRRASHAEKCIDEATQIFDSTLSSQCDGTRLHMQDKFENMTELARHAATTTFSNKAGNQDDDFFFEFLPQLNERFNLIENKFRIINNGKLERAKEMCMTYVDNARLKYVDKMSEPNILGSVDVDDDTIKRLHERGITASVDKFEKLAKDQDPQLLTKFRNLLLNRITAEFEGIVKNNADVRSQIDQRRIEVLRTLVQDHSKKMFEKINSGEICELEKLGAFHHTGSETVKSELTCKIRLVSELREFKVIMKHQLDQVFEFAKSELAKKQVQLKQSALHGMTNATKLYSTRFAEKLKSTSQIFSQEELNSLHHEICKSVTSGIQIPVHFTDAERRKFKSEFEHELLAKLADAQQQNATKLRNTEIQVEQICKVIAEEHKNELLKCDQFSITETELQSSQERHLKISKGKFLDKIRPFGQFVTERFTKIFSSYICEAEKRALTSITSKQQEQDERIQKIYQNSIRLYNAEMDKLVDVDSQHTEQQIKSSHLYVKPKSLEEFELELRKWDVQSRKTVTRKQQLITELDGELDRRQKSNSILLEKVTTETKRWLETNFQNYKTKIHIKSASAKSEDELRTNHFSLKNEIISEFLNGNVGRDREALKATLSENIQLYFENSVQVQFQQTVQQRNDSIHAAVQVAKDVYISSMDSELKDNILHEDDVVQAAHEKSEKQALDTFRSINDETFSRIQLVPYENQLKFEIQNEFESFKTKQKEILEEMKKTAEFHLNTTVQNYELTFQEIFKNAKNVNTFRQDLEQNLEFITRQFFQDCHLPLKSLERMYESRLHRALDSKVEIYKEKFKQAERLKKELDEAIKVYKLKMDQLIGDDKTKHIESTILKNFHSQSAITATEYLNTRDILMTGNVESALRAALKQVFKIYIDGNSLNAQTGAPAIGIDLGTTYSCVAVYTNNGVEVIPNEFRDNITPSYVRYTQAGIVDMVGKPAKNEAHETPRQTIFDVKRLIGRRFADPIVQDDMRLWPFEVVAGGRDGNTPKIKVGSKTVHAEQVSSEVLKNLKKIAETFLGRRVTRAVITVPAYFDDGQRQATKDAGKLAGLEVLGILNEPTAAAIAYSLQHTDEQVRNVLVYDFGGGTFDVVILKMAGGSIEVKAVGGDTHLGGEDVDTRLVDYCVAEFRQKHGVDLSVLPPNSTNIEIEARSRKLRRIRHICEQRKCDLSGECEKVTVAVDAIHGKFDLRVDITRQKFEELNLELFQRTIKEVCDTITKSGVDIDDIDDVVLVGGSTKIPKVQQLLQELFKGKPLRRSVHPDEAVAFGAAIHAAILNGSWGQKMISLTDVTPLTVGIGLINNRFSSIIKKNTPLPAKGVEEYCTSRNNQTVISIPVYEGDDPVANKNNLLGKFELRGIPPGPEGKEVFDVTMNIDLNGILNVKAVNRSTGGQAEINIEESKGRLSLSELSELMLNNE